MGRKSLDTDSCPAPNMLDRYAAKQLIGKQNEAIFLHLRHCSRCLRRMAKITRLPSPGEIIKGSVPKVSLWYRIKKWWPFGR